MGTLRTSRLEGTGIVIFTNLKPQHIVLFHGWHKLAPSVSRNCCNYSIGDLHMYGEQARQVLDSLLDKYADEGIHEIQLFFFFYEDEAKMKPQPNDTTHNLRIV